MKRLSIILSLVLLFGLTHVVWSQPSAANEELMARVLAIAEPDQMAAYTQLNLTERQHSQLQAAAIKFLPRLESAQSQPAGLLRLIPEALSVVDGILTPEQRPLARKLIPRAHQWSQLRSIYADYRS